MLNKNLSEAADQVLVQLSARIGGPVVQEHEKIAMLAPFQALKRALGEAANSKDPVIVADARNAIDTARVMLAYESKHMTAKEARAALLSIARNVRNVIGINEWIGHLDQLVPPAGQPAIRMCGPWSNLIKFLGLDSMVFVLMNHASVMSLATVYAAAWSGDVRRYLRDFGVSAEINDDYAKAQAEAYLPPGTPSSGDGYTELTTFLVNHGFRPFDLLPFMASARPAVSKVAVPNQWAVNSAPAPATVDPNTVILGDVFDAVTTLPESLTTKESTMTTTTNTNIAAAIKQIPAGGLRTALDSMLGSLANGVSIDTLATELDRMTDMQAATEKLFASLLESQKESASLRQLLAAAANAPTLSLNIAASSTESGAIPSGKCDAVPIDEVFPELKGVNLQVPKFTWDGAHPDVPAEIPGYIFRSDQLLRTVMALVAGENTWLQGHTGTGKTTLVEQIAHRLGWPMLRIALDSNVDRSALMGRMQLEADGAGGTRSRWLPGIVERALSGGYILLLDELDAAHPNAIYALQPVLEGKGLTLLEDGGRRVSPTPMFRIAATGNTTGSGDESGLYPATRILSAATLDRFSEFVGVPYITRSEEAKLLQRIVPSMPPALVDSITKFAAELRTAFTTGQLPVSFSPRRTIAFAKSVETLRTALGSTPEAQGKALASAVRGKLMEATPSEFKTRVSELAMTTLGVASEMAEATRTE